MEDISKYLGITYRFAVDEENVNCCSLARKFYEDHGWPQNWDDGKPWPTHPIGYKERLKRYMDENFSKTEDPEQLEFGDVAMMKDTVGGGLGIYAGEGNLICLERPIIEGRSKTVLYRARLWKPYMEMGYKRRR